MEIVSTVTWKLPTGRFHANWSVILGMAKTRCHYITNMSLLYQLHTYACCFPVGFFPACQVRVVRFYVSSPSSSFLLAGSHLPALDRSGPRRTSSGESKRCGPRRTSTGPQRPETKPYRMPKRMPDRMSEDMPERYDR